MSTTANAPLPLDPAAFGLIESVGPATLLQTHIGWVYLIGPYAFKFKKHVRFDFLDFTTLEKRRWACEREVFLNRRLCPELYLGLRPLVRDSDGRVRLSIKEEARGAGATVIDWAVWMNRLPEDRMLDALLKNSKVVPDDMIRLAGTLADFYRRQRAEKLPMTAADYFQTLTLNIDENIREGRALSREVVAESSLRVIESRARHFLATHRDLIDARVRDGFIVDGHGDLRAENIWLPASGPPILFDCIEFNDRFRICDCAQDIAFLAMDLDSRGRDDLSTALLTHYGRACDPELPPRLLNFYLGYRAFVKGKVLAWLARDGGVSASEREQATTQARALFDLSVRYARHEKPALLVFCGPAGSGKSTLANTLAKRLKWAHIATDFVRDELVARDRPRAERYAGQISGRVYDSVIQRAAERLERGQSVIVDGTFSTRALRKRAADVAVSRGLPCILVWADAKPVVIETHLNERAASGECHGSEADAAVSARQQLSFELPSRVDDTEFVEVCRIDTSVPRDESAAAAWDGILFALAKAEH